MSGDFWKPYRESGQVYLPAITQARWLRRFQLGSFLAVVGTECESVGAIHYTHVLYVFEGSQQRPALVVTSEHSEGTGQDGSHFICLFFGGTHFNGGASKDWADLEKFVPMALEMAAEALGISEPPRELPP